MDNSNSNPNNSEPERQAVFSSGAPSTPPDGQNANMTHPFFANHPSQTFNTEAGDIIIGRGKTKAGQSKKWKKIVAVFVIVLVIALIPCIIVVAIKGAEKSHMVQQYNQFANYLLYGQESTSAPSEDCRNNTNCAFDELFVTRNSEESLAYLERALELWNDTAPSLQNVGEADVNSVTNCLDTLVSYARGENMSGELADLWNIYIDLLDAGEGDQSYDASQATVMRWQVVQYILLKKTELKNLCYELEELVNA